MVKFDPDSFAALSVPGHGWPIHKGAKDAIKDNLDSQLAIDDARNEPKGVASDGSNL